MTQTYVGTLTIIDCAGCGMTFGVTKDFERRRRNDHKTFYCPKGCSNYWSQETEEEKLRRALKNQSARSVHLADQLEAERRSKAAIKGHMTRMRNRIVNGVCPWCNRSFLNVQNHVHHMHPEHVEKMREVTQTT